jgi:formylglycine-generating enzyme required for sulfatase activity
MQTSQHLLFIISLYLLSSFTIANSTVEKGLTVSCSEVDTVQAWVEGAEFIMGDNNAYSEEGPAHKVTVSGFWMDVHEVTNAQFEEFVEATGYITVAEKPPASADWGTTDVPPEFLQPGSVLFVPPASGQSMANWWSWAPGTNWRHPDGPDSNLSEKAHFPVIHISFADAQAYAEWAGRSLPTEAQFELAARNKKNSRYPWGGNELAPGGHHHANTWQGSFPTEHQSEDGHTGLAPVGCYASNKYGIHDLIGNVWEWTSNWYYPEHIPSDNIDPKGPSQQQSTSPNHGDSIARVIKGGSYLCAENYCLRYRPAARQAQDSGLGTSHIGFRTVLNPK